MELHEIESIVAPLTAHYLTAQEKLTSSDISIIADINKQIQSRKGKQIRPLLTFLSACCCGLPDSIASDHPIFTAVAAIETLHTSTLIHDDVVDESDIRRGEATVNKLWGNKTAVLLGDYYLALVMQAINDIDDKRITRIFNDTAIQMSEGELLQQQFCGNYNTDKSIYFQIIRKKTALFMAACCKIGATFATDNADIQWTTYNFGENLGMAFQIRDDLLDFKSSKLSGKPQGNDIKEHKCTLPLIFALKKDTNKIKILPILSKGDITDQDVLTITEIIENDNSLQKTEAVLQEYIDKAVQHLLRLPDNTYRNAMLNLANQLQEI